MSRFRRWMNGFAADTRGNLSWLRALAVCCLVGMALPCRANEGVPDEPGAKDALQHFLSGTKCLNTDDFACASKEAVWLDSSAFPQIGKVLSGYASFRQNRYDEAINIIGPVYLVMPAKASGPVATGLYVMAHELAASTIGEAKFALKRPDVEVLPFLLEGTRYRLPQGVVVEDGALECISLIYWKQGYYGLSFGYGLERYDIVTRRYSKEPPGPQKTLMERYLHAEEFRFAVLLAYMDDADGSREWLAKALRDKDGGYREKARKIPKLKPVLDSIGATRQNSKKANGT